MNHDEIVIRVFSELKNMQSYCLSGRRISFSLRTTKVDARLITESLATWCGMLLDFADYSPTLGLENAPQRGRMVSMIHPAVMGMASQDLEASLRFLDDCSHLFIKHICDLPGVFKGHRLLKKKMGELVKSSFAPKALVDLIIFMTGSLQQLERDDKGDHALTIRYYLTVLRFLKKIPITRSDLVPLMVEEYLQDERRLSAVADRLLAGDASVWVRSLNELARDVFSDFSVDRFCPQHGPGRVAEDGIESSFDKYLSMRSDRRVDYLLRKHGFGTLSDYAPTPLPDHSTRTAKFICVPKTWKTLRGISAEPTELQYSQQAVLYSIDEFFRRNPFFRNRIDLHCQEENRRLCRIGSLNQSLATIDLSRASDSVSLQLVREVFRGTKLLPWLLATRSTSVELPDYGVLKTSKFAPMGSSTCFPVECIIFTLIAEVARRAILEDRPGIPVPVPRVFGDDIVCASETVRLVLDGLDQLGFLPNREKSFWTGFYRESCGKEYWYGRDISPIYYRVDGGALASRTTTYDGITSVISLYNALYLNGYNTARRFVLPFIMKKEIRIGTKKFLYTNLCIRSFNGEHGTIVSSMPTNFTVVKKVNRSYQKRVYRIVTWKRTYVRLETLLEESSYAQTVKYCEWFVSSLRRVDGRPTQGQTALDKYARLPIGYEMVPRLRGSDTEQIELI